MLEKLIGMTEVYKSLTTLEWVDNELNREYEGQGKKKKKNI